MLIEDTNSIFMDLVKVNFSFPITSSNLNTYKFNKYDIVLASNEKNCFNFVFCKKNYFASYGNPKDVIIGHVIGGFENILNLKKDDYIEKIECIENIKDENEIIYTNNLNFMLINGDKLFTHSTIKLSTIAPIGSELLYSLVRDGVFSVDTKTASFCSDNTYVEEQCEYENFDSRSVGSVSIRTYGLGRSRIYVYTKDRTSSLAHSIIGFVSNGIELFQYSTLKSKISVKLIPEELNILGLKLNECLNLLKERNIDYELLKQEQNDEDIIVDYTPSTTIEILAKNKVTLTTSKKNNIIKVLFYYDKAPKTIEFFKHSINLKTKKLGCLTASMIYDNTYIFKSFKSAEKYKELMPENIPQKTVFSGEIGITNQSAKRAGYIGIKLEDSSLFGPTGEKFSSTNIIGRIVDPEKLKNIKNNDIIYIQEDM